ncbi:hypothetical protein F511_21285 [Dorcoceras hygrometricum]|uniref:Uncharacterized protein n=1 Tax=Dorcoceras hygrometricum TaxID=472368 RepID=A0A2Z7CZ39_9LAMI|nr:hypothetical protein F511_21285 [Dorcoceras hygrometricum]
MHMRARAQPHDKPAHSLRTAADSWPLLHVRLSHMAGRCSREVARCWTRRSCTLVAHQADAPCTMVADDARTGCALDSANPHTAALEISRDFEELGAAVQRAGRGRAQQRRRTMAHDCAAHVAAACVALRYAISMVAPPPAGHRSGEVPALS